MTSKIDRHVGADAPVLKTGEPPVRTPAPEHERAARRKELDERAVRWKQITDAGGIDAWVNAQLVAKGFTDQDPSRLSDAEKKGYKERKKAEATERRALRKQAWQAYHATHVTHLGGGIHWEEASDPDRFDVDDRLVRAQQNGLPTIDRGDELAKALGMSISRLRWLTFQRDVDTGTHYRRWTIPKRDGSQRTITAPKKELKTAQRWALRNIFERLPVHGAAHGFLAARSIVSNALVHAGADVLVKLDIKDFFPTVTWKRVKGLLRKAGVAEQPATLLALLATESPRDLVEFRGQTLHVATGPRALPQGAPTSPAITNAICLKMDRRLSGLARKLGFKYTRYADDLAFSYRYEGQPDPKRKPPVGVLLAGARAILIAEGFVPHPTKTSVMRPGNQQRVTGLVVNASSSTVAARVPRDVLRRLRAAIHNRKKGKPGKDGESLAQLRGMAAFVYMTDPIRGKKFLDQIAALEAAASAQPVIRVAD
jgi:hypothetical protein